MSAWANTGWGHPVPMGALPPSVPSTPSAPSRAPGGYGDPFGASWTTQDKKDKLSTPAVGLVSGYYRGGGGYTYLWNATTASITIAAGPSAGAQLSPGSSAYSAVLSELVSIGAPNTSSPTGSSGTNEPVTTAAPAGSRFSNILQGFTQAATTAAGLAAQAAAAGQPVAAAPAQSYLPAAPTPSRTPLILGIVGGVVVLGLVFALTRKRR